MTSPALHLHLLMEVSVLTFSWQALHHHQALNHQTSEQLDINISSYLLTSSADCAMKKPTVLGEILTSLGLMDIWLSSPCPDLSSTASSSNLSLTKQSLGDIKRWGGYSWGNWNKSKLAEIVELKIFFPFPFYLIRVKYWNWWERTVLTQLPWRMTWWWRRGTGSQCTSHSPCPPGSRSARRWSRGSDRNQELSVVFLKKEDSIDWLIISDHHSSDQTEMIMKSIKVTHLVSSPWVFYIIIINYIDIISYLTILKDRIANRLAIMVLNPGARQDWAMKPSLSSARQITSSPCFQSQLGMFSK